MCTHKQYGGKECVYVTNALYLIRLVRHADLLRGRLWGVDAMFRTRHWLRVIAGVGIDLGKILDGNNMSGENDNSQEAVLASRLQNIQMDLQVLENSQKRLEQDRAQLVLKLMHTRESLMAITEQDE